MTAGGGKVRGARHHNHGKGLGRVRQSHLGYDLFAAGPRDGLGEIRCYKRPPRLPSFVIEDTELAGMLPDTMIWPARDHEMAKAMVDACLHLHVDQLHEWQRLNKGHTFHFEEFLDWAVARLAKEGKLADQPDNKVGPTVATPVSAETLYSTTDVKGITLDLRLTRFTNGDAWIDAILHYKKTTLTRAWVDPMSGRYRVYRHYPGRWKGLGHSPRMVRWYLGFNKQQLHAMRPEVVGRG